MFAVLVSAHDEWQVSDRRYLSEGSMALLTPAEQAARGGGQPALIAVMVSYAHERELHHARGRHHGRVHGLPRRRTGPLVRQAVI